MKKLRKRFAASLNTAAETSAALWLNLDVPLDLCIKHGAIIRQWMELKAMLGGAKA